MENRLEPLAGHQVVQRLEVQDVHAVEPEPRPWQEILQAVLAQDRAFAVFQAVDPHHGVAAFQDHGRQSGPDEPGHTGDKICLHPDPAKERKAPRLVRAWV